MVYYGDGSMVAEQSPTRERPLTVHFCRSGILSERQQRVVSRLLEVSNIRQSYRTGFERSGHSPHICSPSPGFQGCQGGRKPDYLASWAPAVSFSVFQFLGWTGDGENLAPTRRY